MKKITISIIGLAMLTSACVAEKKPKTPEKIEMYMLGSQLGKGLKAQLKQLGIEEVDKVFYSGIKHAFNEEFLLNDEEMQTAIKSFENKQKEKFLKKYEDNKKKGIEFLAKNEMKEGVKKLENGLQYKIIKNGKGKRKPKSTDTVKVHYKGSLIDGTEFDSSIKRKQPLEIRLDRVIPGWTEGLQRMRVGDKWELYIPYELGYGEAPNPKIPPFSTLIFEVELLSIK